MSNNKKLTFDGTSLQLDFVYGYHGSRCRDNLVYTSTGEILYHIAAVGIVYNPKTHTQRHYIHHTDDIISLTQHPNKKLVATGQIGKNPFISIWDSTTMQTVAICKGFHQRGICSLGFSNDGSYLVSVGLDDDHTIAIWEWAKGRVIASDKGSKERVFDIQLSPYSNTIVSCGVKHIKFWSYSGNSLVAKNGIHGNVGEIQTYLCIFFGHDDGKTYTGTLNGDIYIWEGNTLSRNIAKAHKGPVYVVTTYPDGFLSGGKDSQVKVWGRDFKPVHSIPLGSANIRSLFFDNGKFLVGTKDSEIWEVEYNKEKSVVKLLIEGHGEGELWGLATSPVSHQFVTASDDKQIKVWDGNTKKAVLTIQAKFEARSAGFSPDGALVAVGFLHGHHAVYDAKDGKEVLAPTKGRKEEISVIKFAPNGKFLGVGSHDNFVDIYAAGTWKKVGTLTDNASYITHFDWSEDSKYIVTNSGDYQELCYEVPACTRVKSDWHKLGIKWFSTSTVLGKDLAGIWPPYSDKTDVNSLDKSKSGDLVATGDDFGFVKLLPFPAPKGAKHKQFAGHSAHVTSVAFAHDSSFLISTGGGDQAVFQWKVLSDGAAYQEEPTYENDPFDSDLERENNAEYEIRFEAQAAEPGVQSGMLFQIEEGEPVVLSGNPAAAAAAAPEAERPELASKAGKRRLPGGLAAKPKSGQALSNHVDARPTPKGGLDLDFVYGYRGHDTRNNLFYNKNGQIVYHVAAVGLIYDPKTGAQNQFIGHHTDDILALAMHPDGKLVATGEIGKRPKIIVWDSTSAETDTSSGIPSAEKKATLQGFHERGVAALAFSPDGQFLASVGLDDYHSVAVWDWKRGVKLADGRGSGDKVLTIDFDPNDSTKFVTTGVKHIKFWQIAGNALLSKQGIFGQNFKSQTQLSCVFDKEFAYSAANEGQIYKWQGNTAVGTIDAHTGPIFTLFGSNGKYASGGKDGKVKVWSAGFAKAEQTFDIGAPVRSVAIHSSGKLLVGTQHGGIVEIDEKGAQKVIMQGHGLGELWGLATHPSKNQFVTASDDQNVYVWDSAQRKQVQSLKLSKGARSAAYSPDGGLIAIGHVDGRFSVHEATTLKEVFTDKRFKEAIHEIKFSPNGKYLAVGSHDNFVDIYDVAAGFKREGRASGSSSYITHVDFSEDGEVFVTNSGAYEQLFYQLPKATRITPTKKAISEFKWATLTSVLGDDVQGIWPSGSDGTDVNALDRSHDQDVIATGDDFGFVKLYKYPAPLGAQPRQFPGHSAHVTNVRWTHDDNYLLSIGGGDTAIFQWKWKDTPKEVAEDDTVEEVYDSDIEREKNQKYVSKIEALVSNSEKAPEVSDSPFAFAEAESEAVFSANPFNEHENHHGRHEAGSASLELEYVHGYRAHDARNNLFYTASGNIVYHVAGTGVVLDPKSNTQKFFLEHTDDIVSLAYHAGKDVVATGQVGKKPQISVWSAKTQESLSVLKGIHTVGIAALSFDASGEILASVGLDNDHTIAVYHWRDGTTLASGKGDLEIIFDIVFNPFKENEFITVGVKHVKFWKLAGSQLEAKKGIFGKVGSIQTMVSAAFVSADTAITGGASGELFEWKGQNLQRIIAAHNGPAYTINAVDGGEFLSGGKDGKVLRWGADFKAPKEEIQVGKGKNFTVRSATEKDGVTLVGTIASEIYQIPKGGKPKLIASGHADGELWGLATHPSKAEYATVSDDKTLRVWDVSKRAVIKKTELKQAGRSVEYSPDGKWLAVGYINGSFGLFDADKLEEKMQKRNRKEAIHDIKFSPNGKYLAVGSHDNFVDVYSTDGKLIGTAKGNSSYITHLDWTKDSKYIQTNSGAYEHLLYEVLPEENAVRHVVDRKVTPKLHDFNAWHTWTGVLGDELEGIWPAGSDGTDVNALDTLTNGSFLATGDDFGFVKILPFPAPKSAQAQAKRYPGHSAHVTNVRFTSADDYLISTGGGDRSIFQWKVRS